MLCATCAESAAARRHAGPGRLVHTLIYSAVVFNIDTKCVTTSDSLQGSSVDIGTIQKILAWPLRKDDAHNMCQNLCNAEVFNYRRRTQSPESAA